MSLLRFEYFCTRLGFFAQVLPIGILLDILSHRVCYVKLTVETSDNKQELKLLRSDNMTYSKSTSATQKHVQKKSNVAEGEMPHPCQVEGPARARTSPRSVYSIDQADVSALQEDLKLLELLEKNGRCL